MRREPRRKRDRKKRDKPGETGTSFQDQKINMPDNNVILALDLAVQLGYCVGRPGEKPTMGSISLRSSSTHSGAKFCVLIDWLAPMLQVNRPFRVIYEAPMMSMPKGETDENGRRRGGNAKTMAALIGYANMVEMLCYRWDAQVVQSSSSTARKHFIGNGRHADPKPSVFAECKRRGWNPADHNASDAGALWDMACFQYFPDSYRLSYRT